MRVYRVGVLRLRGYRSWTESLGDDREWVIQALQARLQEEISLAAAGIEGFALLSRYDYSVIVLGPGRGPEEALLRRAERVSPVPVEYSAACGASPLEAQSRASALLGSGVSEGCRTELLAAFHIDLDGITAVTERTSAYEAYKSVLGVLLDVTEQSYKLGGLAQYLGGDNMIAFLPLRALEEFASFIEGLDSVKAGVGLHEYPRRAAALASRALSMIRKKRSAKVEVLGGAASVQV